MSISKEARRQNSHQLLALLIDMIHGDIVLSDSGCRRVADAITIAHKIPLRRIVSTDPELSPTLKEALSAYFAKRDIQHVPEIFSLSKGASQQYKSAAEAMISNTATTRFGKMMLEDVEHLSQTVDHKRFEHLKCVMDVIVIELMQRAARQFQQREVPEGSKAVFWPCVENFLVTHRRPRRKRERVLDEARASVMQTAAFAARPAYTNALPTAHTHTKRAAPEQQVEEITRAGSGLPDCAFSMLRGGEAQDMLPKPRGTARKGRASGVVSAGGCLQRRSGDNACVNGGANTTIYGVDGGVKAASSQWRKPETNMEDSGCVSGGFSKRSYFLCPETKKYEPQCVRGFFS
ncbi:unnamed protein product [Trypanosoma congolense IL3000]|uniref:WGS project CAEQ00000000 data, annotated contig 2286 n=1 Tax=Trypanosoma congolense (strain IL3000) TaxID=1068625 RepID=F9WCW8_TRYCI|nr:unnamed protein product [Trypanosoma congolense IL3000]